MKKRLFYAPSMIGALMILCGCESEMPVAGNDPESNPDAVKYISVKGGNPSGLTAGSRAAAPSLPGVCNADRLKLWIYRGNASGFGSAYSPTINDMVLMAEQPEDKILRFDDNNKNNKVQTHEFTVVSTNYYTSGYSIPALAYTGTEKTLFSYTEDKGIKTHGIYLNSQEGSEYCYYTPELYFGFLQLTNGNNITMKDRLAIVKHNAGTKPVEYPNSQVHGEIYRIVSQLNLNVTEVDANHLVSMEMYLSNVPTAITLYGSHGDNYPVSLATAHVPTVGTEEGEKVLVARTTQFPKEKKDGKEVSTARLSTYLLPSAIGRHLTVRLNYDETVSFGKDSKTGEEIRYKDYDIRPAESHYLPSGDVSAYSEGLNKNGSDVYIYNHLKDEFYSLSNVMVNVSGKFDKVFSETSEVDVQIEVCPTYEDSHEFEFGLDEKQ